ncbi:MAG: CoA transferase subunit A [Candidatus Acidiferrales bacterium]
MKNKVHSTVEEALADISDGASIMFGGFGGAGFPYHLVRGLERKGVRELTVISNNCGRGEGELSVLFRARQIRRVIASFPGPDSKYFQEQFAVGAIELELVPQGTLCERMRAAAAGLPAFYTPVGVGTEVGAGKEERTFNGKRAILETALSADYALIRAHKADRIGNLIYRKAARNFNPIMASAARITIVEAKQVVEVGALDPEAIMTPSIFVDRIVPVAGRDNA